MLLRLTKLPNVGKAIALDLVSIGVNSPNDFRGREPMDMFNALKVPMGKRYDPCVYYTLLSVKHFLDTGERLPWWSFTARGKADLGASFQT